MRSIIALTLFVTFQAHASPDCGEEIKYYIKTCERAINVARQQSGAYVRQTQERIGKGGMAFLAGSTQADVSRNGLTNINSAKGSCNDARKNCWRACDKAAQAAHAKNDQANVKKATDNNEKCADFIQNRVNGMAGETANLEAQGVAGGLAVSEYSK